MKCKIVVDEKWPVFELNASDGSGYNEIEISEEEHQEYIDIFHKYIVLQQKLGSLYEQIRTDRQRRITEDLYPRSLAVQSILDAS